MDPTEGAALRYRGLDGWPVEEIVNALWSGQMAAAAACLPHLPTLAAATRVAIDRLAPGKGRLIYAGAGSAGMVALLDAIDLGDTFDWPSDRLLILLAGGLDLAKGLAAEIEDDADGARRAFREASIGEDDVVVGVSASGRSPFTIAIVEEARRCGALTLGLTGVAQSPLAMAAEHPIVIATGPEVIAGSTRLGAGTAQKIVLNTFSTALMAGLGRVYDNLMVNVRIRNAKLRRRSADIVARIAGVDHQAAEAALARHGTVKNAVLALAGVPESEIPGLLGAAGGNLRRALAEWSGARSVQGK